MRDSTKQKVKLIISELYEGPSVQMLLRKHSLAPETFYKALASDPEIENEYACAQQAKSELFMENLIELADSDDNPNKVRNQIDVRARYARSMKPLKFGDRIDMNVNQTVDIRNALTAAQSRIRQVFDITPQIENTQTGCEPVDADTQPELSLSDLLD